MTINEGTIAGIRLNFAADHRLSRRANTLGRPTAAPPVRSESSRPASAPEAELAQEDTQRRGCVHLVEHPRRAAGAQHVHIVDARNLTITARKGSHGMAIWISELSKGAPDPGWADSGALALETVARGRSPGCSRICTMSRIHGSGFPPRFGQVERASSRANSSGSEIAPTVVTSHTTTVAATQDAMPRMVSP